PADTNATGVDEPARPGGPEVLERVGAREQHDEPGMMLDDVAQAVEETASPAAIQGRLEALVLLRAEGHIRLRGQGGPHVLQPPQELRERLVHQRGRIQGWDLHATAAQALADGLRQAAEERRPALHDHWRLAIDERRSESRPEQARQLVQQTRLA